jgi:hypothetical protein
MKPTTLTFFAHISETLVRTSHDDAGSPLSHECEPLLIKSLESQFKVGSVCSQPPSFQPSSLSSALCVGHRGRVSDELD